MPAAHDSTVPRELLGEMARKTLESDNVSVTLGPPSGYVIRFTNGLTVYLSGDTGLHAEMKSVAGDYFKTNLMVLNLGSSALTSKDAAYVANELVRPAAVIASHVNEGATTGGKVRSSSRTAAFMSLVKGASLSCVEWQDDAVQWRRKVRCGVLVCRPHLRGISRCR